MLRGWFSGGLLHGRICRTKADESEWCGMKAKTLKRDSCCARVSREKFVRIKELEVPADVAETTMWNCATQVGDVHPHFLACPPMVAVLLFD